MLLIAGYTYAQQPHVSAKADTNAILIGQQIKIKLQATVPATYQLQWPELTDSLQNFTITETGKIDTLLQNNLSTISQQIIVTTFDSGIHYIPALAFNFITAKGQMPLAIFTDSIMVAVSSVAVDTSKEIRDIKPPIEVPYTFYDFLPYIIALIVLALIIYFVYRYYLKQKRKQKTIVIQAPKRPAHEIALAALHELRNRKVWQQGDIKGYHTELTDIVRTYIANRFKINAPEFTTDEVLQSIAIAQLTADTKNTLRYTLQLADLVKFAKAHPLPDEQEQ
ncbi:MAG TPA: hypothetical protein PLO59_08785, partial [Bacteroidia bacterium]|nr:hypothetical protein [Bacteroidia bacterium]